MKFNKKFLNKNPFFSTKFEKLNKKADFKLTCFVSYESHTMHRTKNILFVAKNLNENNHIW